MLRFIFTRLSLIIPTFLGIVFLTFILIHLVPGDPVEVQDGRAGDRTRRAMPSCCMRWASTGRSMSNSPTMSAMCCTAISASRSITHRPVLAEFFDLFPATLELSVCAMLFAIIFGLPAGMLAAVKRDSLFDHMVMGVDRGRLFHADLRWGLLLILTFSLDLGWTPVSGRIVAGLLISTASPAS